MRDSLLQANGHNGLRFAIWDAAYMDTSLFLLPLRGGRRWLYHPECRWHYSRDANCVGTEKFDADGKIESDASTALQPDNVIHVERGTDQAGFIAKGLRDPYASQQDQATRFFRVRLKADQVFNEGHLKDSVLCSLWVLDSTRNPMLIDSINIMVREVDTMNYVQSRAVAFIPGDSGRKLDYCVHWPNHVGVRIDYIAIDNDAANLLGEPRYITSFTEYMDRYLSQDSRPYLFAFRLEDEVETDRVDSLRYPVIGLFTELVKNHVKNYSGIPSDFCTTSITSSTYPVYQTRRFLHETGHAFLLTDCYRLYDATVGEYAVQQSLRDIILNYRNIATAARDKEKPWMSLGQVSRYGSVHLREPNIREITVQANIMAALGAKGVGYYCFFSHAISPVDSVSGLVDGNGRAIHMDSYEEDKAAAVRAVNMKLEKIGPTLMQLTWKNDARNVTELDALELNDSIRVTNVVTRDDTTEVLDPENGRYFHIGWLQNEEETEDYLYITNMRTQRDSGRTIELSFAGSTTDYILIESVDQSKAWVIGTDTTFAEAFEPGEGRLYRVRDATRFSGDLLDTLTTVTSGAIFDVYGEHDPAGTSNACHSADG
ncbi:MAG: hypothetical protein IPP94_10675 [Ignavibacteria bacterium]|nr:hypothetical protein [Ignavibacteria bacterium]